MSTISSEDERDERVLSELRSDEKSFLSLLPGRITDYLKRIFRHSKREIGIVLDGPNLLRKVGGRRVSLKEIRKKTEKIGHISRAVAILSPDAPASLIKALSNSGFEPRIVPVGDIHVAIAVEVMRFLKEDDLDVIVIGSRDTRCLPILQKIKSEGAIAIVMGFEPGFAVALKNAADEVIMLSLKEAENTNEGR